MTFQDHSSSSWKMNHGRSNIAHWAVIYNTVVPMGWMLPDIFSGLSFRGLFFFWLVLQSLCSTLISFPPQIKAHTHSKPTFTNLPLKRPAGSYHPAHSEAAFRQSIQLREASLFFFPGVLVQQFSFPKALEDCLPSVGLPHPSPSPFLALLHPNMFGKISVAWWFTSGRYLNVSLPLPHLLFPLQHVY